MNHYWRQQLVQDIAGDPLRWFGLMGRKVFYLLNDWEQYNNLTYAYHKERFAFLQYNPLGWGLLLIGAASCCWFFRASLDGRLLLSMGGVFALYAAGVLLVLCECPLPITTGAISGNFLWWDCVGPADSDHCVAREVSCLVGGGSIRFWGVGLWGLV